MAGPLKTDPPLVDVLVLNWRGGRTLPRCLDSLKAQTYPAMGVTVIDNASTDGSPELVRSSYPSVDLFPLPANIGFGPAYNRAIRRSTAEFVALVNNDAYPAPAWLEHLVFAMQQDNKAAACTSRILIEGTGRLHHAGGTLTYAGTGWDVGYGVADGPEFDAPRPAGCFSGAAALLRKPAFLQAGGFDEKFFAYCEDADLSWTFWQMGYRVLYVPSAVVSHEYGASGGGRYSPFRIRHAQRNRLASMLKHVEGAQLPLALLLSFAFDCFRLASYVAHGRWSLASALLRGTAAALRDLPLIGSERAHLAHLRVIPNAHLQRLGVLASPAAAIREYLRLEFAQGADKAIAPGVNS